MELKVIPPFQFIISAGLMYFLAFYFPAFYYDLPHSWLASSDLKSHFSLKNITTIIVVLFAIIIASFALWDFHKYNTTFHPHTPEKTTSLVNSGIYAYSRNPMYLAMVITLSALAFHLQNLSCFAIVPLFIYYITHFQIVPEEKILTKLFTAEYKAYCTKVRRWL